MFERIVGNGWGAVTLSPSSRSIDFGGPIDGLVEVEAKRDLGPGELTVALTCSETRSRVVPSRRSNGISFSRQKNSSVVWRNDVVVDAALVLAEGSTISLPWTLNAAAGDPAERPSLDLPEWASGAIGVIDTITFADRKLQWRLEARFAHAEGFTLRHNVEVWVS